MSGGILRLVYTSEYYKNPNVTFFKSVVRRNVNFAKEISVLPVDNFGFGQLSELVLPRTGDLINTITLKITLPNIVLDNTKFAWVKYIGYAILKYVKIEIGSQIIDTIIGEWLYIWSFLCPSSEKYKYLNSIIGNVQILTNYNDFDKPEYELYVPIPFWFNNKETTIPIIAIRYQDIKLKIKLEKLNKLIVTNDVNYIINTLNPKIQNLEVYLDYIYLDLEYRKYFATKDTCNIIEQHQYIKDNIYDKNNIINLNFTQYAKDLFWLTKNLYYNSCEKFLCYTDNNWSKEIVNFSYTLIKDSSFLSSSTVFDNCDLKTVKPYTNCQINSKIFVTNNSKYYFNINTDSLVFNGTSLISKISCKILVDKDKNIVVSELLTSISVEDISVPVKYYDDNRLKNSDVYINQFTNFGKYIDGSGYIIKKSKLLVDGYDYINYHDSVYFNNVQPYLYYNDFINNGINVFSFSVYPLLKNPSGEINFSKYDKKYLYVDINDKKNKIVNINSIKETNYKPEYELLVVTRVLNTLIVSHGLIGINY